MISYAVTLSDALTPITLISGVGLLLLAMTARYNYTTDRVRALLKERRQKAPAVDPVLEKAIRLTYERSHLLKNAILAVTTSAAFSGILVLVDDSRASFGPSTWRSGNPPCCSPPLYSLWSPPFSLCWKSKSL